MARNLSYRDMIDIISLRTGKSRKTVERIYDNLLDIIADELRNNSYIKLKNLGEFQLEQRGGEDEIFLNKFGFQEKRYVEPYYVVDIKANQGMLDYINGNTDTFVKTYRKRKRKKYESKDESYANFLEQTTQSEFDDFLFDLTTKRKANTDYINRWQKGEVDVDSKNKRNSIEIYCSSNGVTYPSIISMAKDLGIDKEKLYSRIRRGYTNCDGYEFEIIG